MAVKTDLEISSVKYKDKYGHTTEIPVKSSGEDMLQARVDATNSCAYLFYGYKGESLDFIDKLDTSKVTDMEGMFKACRKLKFLNVNFDTSNVTDMSYMFSQVANNNALSEIIFGDKFNTSSVTDMEYMFENCEFLTEVDLSNFVTSSVTEMNNMFYNCKKFTNLDLSNFNTKSVISMGSMFYRCSMLENILGIIDMINVTSVSSMFSYCSNLQSVILKNIKKSGLTIGSGTSYGHLLTLDTLINTVKELWDYSSGTTTYTLTMSTPSKTALADVYVKLVEPTAEQIEADPNIVNKMPCEVCESTDEGAMLITDYATLKKWAIK